MEDQSTGQVEIEYDINHNPLDNTNGDMVKLRNDPQDANYFFYLEVEATDVAGDKAHGFEFISFTGHSKTGTLEYDQDVMKCRMRAAKGRLPKALEIAELMGYMKRLNPKISVQDLSKELNMDRITNKVAEMVDKIGDPKLQRTFGKMITQAKSLGQTQMVAQMGALLGEMTTSMGTTRLKSKLRQLSELGERAFER